MALAERDDRARLVDAVRFRGDDRDPGEGSLEHVRHADPIGRAHHRGELLQSTGPLQSQPGVPGDEAEEHPTDLTSGSSDPLPFQDLECVLEVGLRERRGVHARRHDHGRGDQRRLAVVLRPRGRRER